VSHEEPTPVVGRLIDARYELLQHPWGPADRPLYNHAVLCSTSLPYRNPGDDVRSWERSNGRASLLLEAGAIPNPRGGGWKPVGLPYGPRARLVLLHLCSEAVKLQSPTVEVQKSFTAFARELGLADGGRNLRTLRDQTVRMAVVGMRIAVRHPDHIDQYQGPVFRRLEVAYGEEPQLSLWGSVVEFSEGFYASLRESAVPLRREAIGALKHSAQALDVYVWLAYRLWRVRRPVMLRWDTLQAQFGRPEQHKGGFRRRFKQALNQALMVYPSAKVEVLKDGLKLYQSAPPVPEKWLDRPELGLLR
tara:strand:- start:1374 stop:2288 length:915 start_codon:yes stop_codon:yes gene_type:complete